MIFWDSSAVVPLLLQEEASSTVHASLRGDRDVLVWWGTYVEVASALARREREGFPRSSVDAARKLLAVLKRGWYEITPSEEVRLTAARLLLRHSLRAADSLQLAAALVWCRGDAEGRTFLCFDERLLTAARSEGFDTPA